MMVSEEIHCFPLKSQEDERKGILKMALAHGGGRDGDRFVGTDLH
jgi:hypothetical protein